MTSKEILINFTKELNIRVKKNQLDAQLILISSTSTCFGRIWVHHQEVQP